MVSHLHSHKVSVPKSSCSEGWADRYSRMETGIRYSVSRVHCCSRGKFAYTNMAAAAPALLCISSPKICRTRDLQALQITLGSKMLSCIYISSSEHTSIEPQGHLYSLPRPAMRHPSQQSHVQKENKSSRPHGTPQDKDQHI